MNRTRSNSQESDLALTFFSMYRTDDGYVENTEVTSLEDIKTKLVVLDSKIANDMWFV